MVVLITSVSRPLKLVEVTNHWTKVQALLDSGAVANLLSSKLARHLSIEKKVSPKKITVANGDVTDTLGAASNLRTSFKGIQVSFDFLLIDNPLFDVIIGLPALESIQACIDPETQTPIIRQD